MSLKIKADDISYWDKHRGVVRSRKGGWVMGEGVFNHGYSMMDDLVGNVSYMQVMVLNAIGRLPERRFADWLEAFHICLSWPDPRIWCNQVGALGGASECSVVASTVAGVLAADSSIYGIRPIIEGVRFIQRALEIHRTGLTAQEIVAREIQANGGKVSIMGYARPIAKGDERIPAMERVAEVLGYAIGEHLALAYEIEEVLVEQYDETMNILGYVAAFLADQGVAPEEAYRMTAVVVSSGVTACYVDSRDRPAGSFLPLRCEDIEYAGRPPREVPDP